MGCKSYAEFAIRPNMAASPDVALSFLLNLSKSVRCKADEVLKWYLLSFCFLHIVADSLSVILFNVTCLFSVYLIFCCLGVQYYSRVQEAISKSKRCWFRAMGWGIFYGNDEIFCIWHRIISMLSSIEY